MARRMVSSAFLSMPKAEAKVEPAIGVVDDSFFYLRPSLLLVISLNFWLLFSFSSLGTMSEK
jgi:hypothetical protein